MNPAEYDRLAEMEESYWWHVGRKYLLRRLLEQHLPPRRDLKILDVGCGAGGNLPMLDAFGDAIGLEPPGPGLETCKRRGLSEQVVEGSALSLPFDDNSFDLVSSLDVIEHLDDDLGALREMTRVVRPGGHVLITVPAFRFLWSTHDEALGHRRRYVAPELNDVMTRAGLNVARCTYAVSTVFPAVTAVRVLQGLFPSRGEKSASYVGIPDWANRALTMTLKAESHLLDRLNLPAGTSAVAIGVKP